MIVGIKEVCWHDLRYKWGSWLVQAGTLLYILQEFGAWGSFEIERKCADLYNDNLTQYVDRFATIQSEKLERFRFGLRALK